MPEDYFLENRDYIVKEKVLGRGGVGKVYEVSVHSDSTKEVVVKKVKLFPCWFHWWCSDVESKFLI